MDIDWMRVINNISIFAISSGLFTLLLKKAFEIYLEKDIERHKNKLNHELEKFKNELKIIEIERQVTYTRLHNDRVEIIKELYQKIVKLKTDRSNIDSTLTQNVGEYDLEQNIKKIINELWDIHSFYNNNKIYFNKKIDQLMNAVTITTDYLIEAKTTILTPEKHEIRLKEILKRDKKSMAQFLDELKKNYKKIEEEEDRLLRELEAEFRNYLGVD